MASSEIGVLAFGVTLEVPGSKAKASAREGNEEGFGAKFKASSREGNILGLSFFTGPIKCIGEECADPASIRSRGNSGGEFSLAAVEVSSMQSARQMCKLLLGVVCVLTGGTAWFARPAKT